MKRTILQISLIAAVALAALPVQAGWLNRARGLSSLAARNFIARNSKKLALCAIGTTAGVTTLAAGNAPKDVSAPEAAVTPEPFKMHSFASTAPSIPFEVLMQAKIKGMKETDESRKISGEFKTGYLITPCENDWYVGKNNKDRYLTWLQAQEQYGVSFWKGKIGGQVSHSVWPGMPICVRAYLIPTNTMEARVKKNKVICAIGAGTEQRNTAMHVISHTHGLKPSAEFDTSSYDTKNSEEFITGLMNRFQAHQLKSLVPESQVETLTQAINAHKDSVKANSMYCQPDFGADDTILTTDERPLDNTNFVKHFRKSLQQKTASAESRNSTVIISPEIAHYFEQSDK